MLTIQFKKLNESAIKPTKERGNAGYDLSAIDDVDIPPFNRRIVKTGISIAIPDGFYGHISDRSGMAWKKGAHCMGKIIDSIYRGEIGVIILNTDPDQTISIKKGDRVAQIVFKRCEEAEFEEVLELDETSRGERGYGSSGN